MTSLQYIRTMVLMQPQARFIQAVHEHATTSRYWVTGVMGRNKYGTVYASVHEHGLQCRPECDKRHLLHGQRRAKKRGSYSLGINWKICTRWPNWGVPRGIPQSTLRAGARSWCALCHVKGQHWPRFITRQVSAT